MKINHNLQKRYEASFKWHKWFAWYPVSDGDTIVWLEYVYRKRGHIHEIFWWDYDFLKK